MDKLVQICNKIINELINQTLKQKYSVELNALFCLFQIMVNDLMLTSFDEAVEFPIGYLLIKSIVIQLMQIVQYDNYDSVESKEPIELHHKIFFVDILKSVMCHILEIILDSSSSKSKTCYCSMTLNSKE